MWYLLFLWMEYKKQIKRCILVTLPSVTLGKEVLCRVSGLYHSAKNQYQGTGMASLLSALALTLGKEASFTECLIEHSVKNLTKGTRRWILCRVLVGRPLTKR
jgi:hypothetical protein